MKVIARGVRCVKDERMLVGRSQEPESRSQEAAGGYMTSIAAEARSPVAATVPLYPGSSETEAFARRHTLR